MNRYRTIFALLLLVLGGSIVGWAQERGTTTNTLLKVTIGEDRSIQVTPLSAEDLTSIPTPPSGPTTFLKPGIDRDQARSGMPRMHVSSPRTPGGVCQTTPEPGSPVGRMLVADQGRIPSSIEMRRVGEEAVMEGLETNPSRRHLSTVPEAAIGSADLTMVSNNSSKYPYHPNAVNSFTVDSWSQPRIIESTVSIGNVGTASSTRFRIGWYLSTDTNIETSDFLVGFAWDDHYYQPNSWDSHTLTMDLEAATPHVTPGTYYLGFYIDDLEMVYEGADVYGNDWYWGQNQITYIGIPNLKIYRDASNPSVQNVYSYNETTHIVTMKNCIDNNGTGDAGNFRVGWYLSRDISVGPGDLLVSTQWVDGLDRTHFERADLPPTDLDDLTPALASGCYYMIIAIDDTGIIPESDDSDNFSYTANCMSYSSPRPILTAVSAVDFGTKILGSGKVQRSVTLSNTGSALLQITGISLTNTPVFSIESGGGSVFIAPGGNHTVELSYTPSLVGQQQATLSVMYESGDPQFPHVVHAVQLTGFGAARQPRLQMEQSSWNFGPVTVLSTATGNLRVNSTGNCEVVIQSAELRGAHKDEFRILSSPSSPLAASTSAFYQITFTPQASGDRFAELWITSNDVQSPTTVIYLRGTGVQTTAPRLAVQSALDFGSTGPNTPVDRTLVVRNEGTAPLVITGIDAPGSPFSLMNQGSSTLPVGGQTDITVRYYPSAAGSHSGQIRIRSNDAMSPAIVNLIGMCQNTGTPRLMVNTTTVDFGACEKGSVDNRRRIAIHNVGTGTLRILDAVTVPNTIFEKEWQDKSDVGPGDSAIVSIIFKPTASIEYTGTLTITTNDIPMTVHLRGSGKSAGTATCTITPGTALINFGRVMLGGFRTEYLTIQNTGNAPLELQNIRITENQNIFYPDGGSMPTQTTIHPNSTVLFSLRFEPKTDQLYTSTFAFTTNDPLRPQMSVVLVGNGSLTGMENPAVEKEFALMENYPNPVVETTTIPFIMKHRDDVSITIHDERGQRVRHILQDSRSEGTHSVQWDGRDDQGLRLPAGTYWIILRNARHQSVRGCILR